MTSAGAITGILLGGILAAIPAEQRVDDALAWLDRERESLAHELAVAHEAIADAARAAGRQDLLARLSPTPPAPRGAGWGLLPELRSEDAIGPLAPREQRFSLRTSSTAYASFVRDAALLAVRATDGRLGELESELAQLERLRSKLDNLEDHLAYHRLWQRRVVEEADVFAERNQLLADVRAWRDERARDGERERADLLSRAILDRLAPFEATPGLAIERTASGERVLRVPLVTDVDDAAFLERLRSAVRAAFDDAPAARERHLRVELEIAVLPIAELYPEDPPRVGDAIDTEEHLARFPAGALVVTTGAASTHAFRGRSLHLGSGTTTERELAHELAHLLGFHDAYLRAYDGDPSDPWGVELVEWTGLRDDLMGDRRRPVSAAMVERLIEAYGG